MIVVVIPSRGRPDRAAEAIEAIRQTAVLVDTAVVLAVDQDDSAWSGYARIVGQRRFLAGPETTLVTLRGDETGNLVRATNTVSMRIAASDPGAIIGNLGDDHLCRTPGWDRLIAEALTEPGIAYGNDLLQGPELPTAPFISAVIVNALGYYFLPDVSHMYVDNAVRDIGEQTGTLRYLPEIVIEHVHPYAGKVPWDVGYVRVNAEDAVREDRLHYESWREHAMPIDVGRVRDALRAAA